MYIQNYCFKPSFVFFLSRTLFLHVNYTKELQILEKHCLSLQFHGIKKCTESILILLTLAKSGYLFVLIYLNFYS